MAKKKKIGGGQQGKTKKGGGAGQNSSTEQQNDASITGATVDVDSGDVVRVEEEMLANTVAASTSKEDTPIESEENEKLTQEEQEFEALKKEGDSEKINELRLRLRGTEGNWSLKRSIKKWLKERRAEDTVSHGGDDAAEENVGLEESLPSNFEEAVATGNVVESISGDGDQERSLTDDEVASKGAEGENVESRASEFGTARDGESVEVSDVRSTLDGVVQDKESDAEELANEVETMVAQIAELQELTEYLFDEIAGLKDEITGIYSWLGNREVVYALSKNVVSEWKEKIVTESELRDQLPSIQAQYNAIREFEQLHKFVKEHKALVTLGNIYSGCTEKDLKKLLTSLVVYKLLGNLVAHYGLPFGIPIESVEHLHIYLMNVLKSTVPVEMRGIVTTLCLRTIDSLVVKKMNDVSDECRRYRMPEKRRVPVYFGLALVENIPTKNIVSRNALEDRVHETFKAKFGEVTATILLEDSQNRLSGNALVAFFHKRHAADAINLEKIVFDKQTGRKLKIECWKVLRRATPEVPTERRLGIKTGNTSSC